MSHNITVEGGTSVRLPTAGKYCDKDIIITATGSGGGGIVDIYDPVQNPVEQGNIQSSTGADYASTNRLRTKGYIKVKPNTAYRISTNVAKFFILYCADDKSVIKNSGWQSSPYLFNADPTCVYIRFAFQNSSGSTITVDEFEWMKIEQLEGGGSADPVIEPLEIIKNGTYTAPEGVDGFSPIVANVPKDTSFEDELVTHTVSAEEYANDRITTVGYGTFYECGKIKKVSLPNVTTVGGYAFYKCSALETIDMPLLKNAGSYAFSYTKPSVINLPSLDTITTYTFSDITATTKVIMPRLKTAGNSSFRNSKGIVLADLAVCTKVDNLSFYYANGLKALVLRNTETMCTLQNANAFTGTEIAKGTGYIYVPRVFLNDNDSTLDYRQMTNWATFSAQFRVLEDFTVDGTTTGALDESKI